MARGGEFLCKHVLAVMKSKEKARHLSLALCCGGRKYDLSFVIYYPERVTLAIFTAPPPRERLHSFHVLIARSLLYLVCFTGTRPAGGEY